MKTTTIENKMLKAIKGNNNSLITISEDIITEALNTGLIIKIAERTSRNGNQNVYYEIKSGKHDILMHVQNNMYVIISRYVHSFLSEELIDVIPYLLHFAFYVGRTNSNRCHVMANCPKDIQRAGGFGKTLYLTRILVSLEICGTIINLKSDWDVHHKGDCFDNRQYMIMYIPSSEHTHRNNHMTGQAIRSCEALKGFIQFMDYKYENLSVVTKVA